MIGHGSNRLDKKRDGADYYRKGNLEILLLQGRTCKSFILATNVNANHKDHVYLTTAEGVKFAKIQKT